MEKIRDEDRYTTLEQSEILEPIEDREGIWLNTKQH